ncbi:hypothetical protein [Escherichia coli]|uniref:hypothetical protein n=1 Tax=Escherichia coli TaxID=562 RepID=UPI00165D50C7|nr:hypothetical protein [Escherichia coli]HAZ7389796.1 hypothetical protein [Escherichia coli]
MSKIDYQALREIAKHQRLTEESASYARTNHSLTLDESCSLLNDIQTYRNNVNPTNGDSRWKKKSSLVKRQHRI